MSKKIDCKKCKWWREILGSGIYTCHNPEGPCRPLVGSKKTIEVEARNARYNRLVTYK